MQASSQLDHIFGALADPTRRAMLARLALGAASVTELTPPHLSQPTISKHLQVLEKAGLVTRGREGRFRPCHLQAAPLEAAAGWLGDYRRFWEESLDNLETYVVSLQHDAKETRGPRRQRRS